MILQLVLLVVLATEVDALVSCGGHSENDCSLCPGTKGRSWCFGDCMWCHETNQCYPRGSDCTTIGNVAKIEGELKQILERITKLEQIKQRITKLETTEKKQNTEAAAQKVEIARAAKEVNQVKERIAKIETKAKKQNTDAAAQKVEIGHAAKEVKQIKQRITKLEQIKQRITKLETKVEKHGNQTAAQIAQAKVALNGGWSPWSDFSNCSCRIRAQTRGRSCTNPTPENGGSTCHGPSTQTKPCSAKNCKGADFHGCSGLTVTFQGRKDSKQDSYKEKKSVNSVNACCQWCAKIRSAEGKQYNGFLYNDYNICYCLKNGRGFFSNKYYAAYTYDI